MKTIYFRCYMGSCNCVICWAIIEAKRPVESCIFLENVGHGFVRVLLLGLIFVHLLVGMLQIYAELVVVPSNLVVAFTSAATSW